MPLSTRRICFLIKKVKPDIVHLHCLNGYFVNVYQLISFLKKNDIKTILTNHAEFMYTANCGITPNCQKWINCMCKNCQKVKEFNGKLSMNRTYKFYRKMFAAFDGFKRIKITNVSPWLNSCSQKSKMFNRFENCCILNPVDETFFKYSTKNPYLSFDLPAKCLKVLFVTASFDNPLKGANKIYRILDELKGECVNFFIISSNNAKTFRAKKGVTLLQNGITQNELADYYHYADCSILLSEKETFSMIVAESLCEGTPVVGFRAGGPETISINAYSLFAEQNDFLTFANYIKKAAKLKADSSIISSKAREKYNRKIIANEYLRIYGSFNR